MSKIKGEWIDHFIDKLIEYDYETFREDEQYAYQLAVAYFDWADVDEPEETVEEAFARYVRNDNEE